jgi:hypothetical protein
MPTFTSTPYSEYAYGSFYAFYINHSADTMVKTDLNLLSTPITQGEAFNQGWGQDIMIYLFFSQGPAKHCGLYLGTNVMTPDDVAVANGALFNSTGGRNYDVAILGHEEYVTVQEYAQFQRFVSAGGRLVEMSGNSFYARVNLTNGIETLVAGHGWTFNGTVALKSPIQPFETQNTNWFGSNYLSKTHVTNTAVLNCSDSIGAALEQVFGKTITQTYTDRLEVNTLSNRSYTSITASWNDAQTMGVYSYVHKYRLGYSVCLCVYSEANLFSDNSLRYFLVDAIMGPLVVHPPCAPAPIIRWTCNFRMVRCRD